MKPQHILILFSMLIIGRAIIITLHEMGHALAAAALSKKNIEVYLGSYGGNERNITFRTGLITWHVYNNPMYWRGGLCKVNDTEMEYNQKLMYILAGPLFPALFAMIFLVVTQFFQLHENIIVFAIFLLIGSVFGMIYNLIPSSNPIKLNDGTTTNNDGQSLKQLFKYRKVYNEYQDALKVYRDKNYHKSAEAFMNLISRGLNDYITYRYAISSFLLIKQYGSAKPLIEEFLLKFNLDSDDYCNAGLTFSYLNLNEKAIELYLKSLKLNPLNANTLNNIGYALNLLERYEEAISYFDKAIQIEPNMAYPYNNRGLSKIKTGAIDRGLEDFKKSFSLNPDNSYYFKNLGIYHFDKQEYNEALTLFYKAKELDSSTYNIDVNIMETLKLT